MIDRGLLNAVGRAVNAEQTPVDVDPIQRVHDRALLSGARALARNVSLHVPAATLERCAVRIAPN